MLSGIPTHFIDLLNHPKLAETDVSSLRTGWIGGADNPGGHRPRDRPARG